MVGVSRGERVKVGFQNCCSRSDADENVTDAVKERIAPVRCSIAIVVQVG